MTQFTVPDRVNSGWVYNNATTEVQYHRKMLILSVAARAAIRSGNT